MLSKNNKILVGCLALLLAMSVGYALFSDTITINGSATASGEFSLTTTCDMGAEALEAAGAVDSGSVTDATITCDNNVVNALATLGYPGSQKWFRVMVTNTGTIPAKLKQVVELNDPENMTFKKDNDTFGGMIYNSQGDSTNSASAWLYRDIGYTEDYAAGALGVDTSWDVEQFDAVLDPGETAYFYVLMEWNQTSTTPGNTLTPTLNAQIDWEQVTE